MIDEVVRKYIADYDNYSGRGYGFNPIPKEANNASKKLAKKTRDYFKKPCSIGYTPKIAKWFEGF